MKIKSFLAVLIVLFGFCQNSLTARPESFHGKTSRGVIFLDIDIISDGEIDRNIDLFGLSDEAMILVWKNVFIRPSMVVAEGNHGDAELLNVNLAVGALFPFWCNRIIVSPAIGGGGSVLRFYRDVPQLDLQDVRQKFYTTSYFAELGVAINPHERFMISGSIQYAWADTTTIISNVLNTSTNSRGINAGVQVDYFVNDCWSVNGAYGIIHSRNKERNGNEIDGWRFGVTYWF